MADQKEKTSNVRKAIVKNLERLKKLLRYEPVRIRVPSKEDY